MQKEKNFNKTAYDNQFIANNYDRINLTMPKGGKAIVKDHAEKRGESVNGFINRAIDETMQKDNEGSTQDE